MIKMDNFGIRHSPLTDSLYLCRFGKDPRIALDKRDCEAELMEAITSHMMLDAPKGSRKIYMINDQWYEIKITPAATEQKDDVISHLDYELDRRDAQVKTILEWCRGNIESKSQISPFCVQVRDLIEGEGESDE